MRDPDGAVRAVLNDQDHRALEAQVADPGRGDQQLAGERGASRRFVRPSQRRPEERRLQDAPTIKQRRRDAIADMAHLRGCGRVKDSTRTTFSK